MAAPEMFNPKSVIDVNSSPEEEIAALPEFLRDKIYASEEWAGRLVHKTNMEKLGQGEVKAKDFRPDSVKDRIVAEEGKANPDDVPF